MRRLVPVGRFVPVVRVGACFFVEGWLGARCWVVRERPCGGFFVGGRVSGGFVPCGVRFRACVENFIVDASIFVVSIDMCVRQATECDRWMPRHQEPMKDVVTCDKPRGAGGRALIRGFPNGGTSKVTGREAGDCSLNV